MVREVHRPGGILATMRVHFAIVAEATPAYCAMARLLASSIRLRAGALCTSPIKIVFNDRQDERTAEELRKRWGVHVLVKPRISQEIGFLNKYNGLDREVTEGADWILILDCDTIVCSPLDGLWAWMDSDPEADVAAVPVLAKTAWGLEQIYRTFAGCSAEDLSRMRHPWFVSDYPYFNSGVIALRATRARAFQQTVLEMTRSLYREMSTSLSRPFNSLRLRWNRKVCKTRHADQLVIGPFFTKFYAEQVGMSASILRLGLRYSVWPHAWNWRVPDSGHGEDSPIRILHYLGARYRIDREHMLEEGVPHQGEGEHAGWQALRSAIEEYQGLVEPRSQSTVSATGSVDLPT